MWLRETKQSLYRLYVRPTVLAPGWPRATRKRSRPDHTCKYVFIHVYIYMYVYWSKLAYCESNNASHGNDKRGYRGYRNAKRGYGSAKKAPPIPAFANKGYGNYR